MKKIYLNVVIAALFASSSMSYAADLRATSSRDTVVFIAEPLSWQGSYWGGQLTFFDGDFSFLTSEEKAKNSPATRRLSQSRNGFGLGLFGGFNQVNDRLVVGAEIDAQYYILSSRDYTTANGFISPDDIKNPANISLRARLGVAHNNLLGYLAGGVMGTYIQRDIARSTGLAQDVRTNNFNIGWTLGAGLDMALDNNLLVRVEYRYNNLGKDSRNEMVKTAADSTDTYTLFKDSSASSKELRVGVGMRY